MGCERAIKKPVQLVLNNFAVNRTATIPDWPLDFIFCVSLGGVGGVTCGRIPVQVIFRPTG